MLTEKSHVLQIADADDWDLIVKVCHHSFNVDNLKTTEWAELYRLVYAQSDGYGEKGFIPCQGYDWSGVRDSTDQAKADMAQVIRDYLEKHGILALHVTQRVY
jgi:hypothetical protein